MKPPTQAERILAFLRDRGPAGASNFELMRISYQYPARLHTLRHRDGHIIDNKHVKDQEWRITLVREAGRPEPVQEAMPMAIEPRKRQYAQV